MDSVFHKSLSKINDKTKLQTSESEICQYLAFKYLIALADRFTFQDDFSLNFDINPKR